MHTHSARGSHRAARKEKKSEEEYRGVYSRGAGVGGEMLLSQQIFRTRAESQRVAWQACSPAYNTLSHIQVVCKGFISANILKGDVSDVGPEAIAIRVTSAEVIIVAFQHGF